MQIVVRSWLLADRLIKDSETEGAAMLIAEDVQELAKEIGDLFRSLDKIVFGPQLQVRGVELAERPVLRISVDGDTEIYVRERPLA